MIRRPSDLVALVTVFLLTIGFTYSDDIVEFLLHVRPGPGPIPGLPGLGAWLVLGLDCLLVAASAVVTWWINGPWPDVATFLRRLLTGWWSLGAALVVASHLVMIGTAQWRAGLSDGPAVAISLLASLVYVLALTMLMLAALSGERGPRTWVVPLVGGTAVVYLASALWYPVIDANPGCAGEIAASFFTTMAEILAVVLLALGIELNFLRRSVDLSADPGRRVSPVFTVCLLGVAILLSFSMLVKADLGTPCGLPAVWHEYIAFTISVQALSIGLATLLWLLISDAARPSAAGRLAR